MKSKTKKKVIKKLLGHIALKDGRYVFVIDNPEPLPPIETIWFPYKESND